MRCNLVVDSHPWVCAQPVTPLRPSHGGMCFALVATQVSRPFSVPKRADLDLLDDELREHTVFAQVLALTTIYLHAPTASASGWASPSRREYN